MLPTLALLLALAAGDADQHAYVEAVHRYRAAKQAEDFEAIRQVLAEDSRIWFDEKKGPGNKRTVGGRGPWADWDGFFKSESQILDTLVADNSLRTTVREINDWYRLVERPASTYYITYDFDADGRIEGTLIHSIPDRPKPTKRDRLDEFKTWANKKHPGLIDELLPNDQIDPSLAKCKLWKQRLLEWRAELGLGNPLGGGNAK